MKSAGGRKWLLNRIASRRPSWRRPASPAEYRRCEPSLRHEHARSRDSRSFQAAGESGAASAESARHPHVPLSAGQGPSAPGASTFSGRVSSAVPGLTTKPKASNQAAATKRPFFFIMINLSRRGRAGSPRPSRRGPWSESSNPKTVVARLNRNHLHFKVFQRQPGVFPREGVRPSFKFISSRR